MTGPGWPDSVRSDAFDERTDTVATLICSARCGIIVGEVVQTPRGRVVRVFQRLPERPEGTLRRTSRSQGFQGRALYPDFAFLDDTRSLGAGCTNHRAAVFSLARLRRAVAALEARDSTRKRDIDVRKLAD